jgi:hypothetical protein
MLMKKRSKLTPLDINRCPQGYYWVRAREGKGTPKIMELRDGGRWWHMGWDIHQRDMTGYEVLGPVVPFSGGSHD